WCEKPGIGRRKIARTLAQCWADKGRDVLLIQIGDAPYHPNPAGWVRKFRSLSPFMLRNFLADPQKPYGRLHLQKIPEAPVLQDLLGLAANAYAWTVMIGPLELSAEALPILDASALLLWVGDKFQEFLSALTPFHFPHVFAHHIVVPKDEG